MWPRNKMIYPVSYPNVEFDIEGEHVFSIEWREAKYFNLFGKYIEYSKPRTTIGFYAKRDSALTEWEFYCSPEKHGEFVRRLQIKLGLIEKQ